jgi:hypothetical protein
MKTLFARVEDDLVEGAPSVQVGLTLAKVGKNCGVRSRLVELPEAVEIACVRYLFAAIAVGHVPGPVEETIL